MILFTKKTFQKKLRNYLGINGMLSITVFGPRNNPCPCPSPVPIDPLCGDRGVEDDD
jgi:hypothetical protein